MMISHVAFTLFAWLRDPIILYIIPFNILNAVLMIVPLYNVEKSLCKE